MKNSLKVPVKSTIQALEELKFDVAREIHKHIRDVDSRIDAETAKNKPSKVILESLLKEREQMLSAIVPFQFTKPEKVVVVEDEEYTPLAVALNIPERKQKNDHTN